MKMKPCIFLIIYFKSSYILFQKALVVPNSNPPYPSLIKPNAPLLSTRLLNVAIQTFSQLFVYTGSGNRGHMIEVVLSGMAQSNHPETDKQMAAYNILCILWCVVDVRDIFSYYYYRLLSSLIYS